MASYNTVITNEGAALLASVIANQGTLTFSEMRFSTTDYDGVEQTLTVGTFGGVFITAAASASVVDSTTIKVGAQFDNSGIVGDHPLYSIGIVGTDGNTTALIAVCTTTNPDIIRAALTGVSTYAFNVNLTVSSTSNITVTGTTAAVLYDTDTVNHLNSTDTKAPLSANMGRVLEEQAEAIVNVYGAKNIVKNELYKYGASVTSHDVTFTQMQDDTISMSGTATAGIGIAITPNGFYAPVSGDYKLSGGDSTDLALVITDHNGAAVATAYGTEITVTLNAGEKYTLWISVANGTVATGRYFYPMIRDARIVNPTYEPCAETNQQLTVNKANRADLASINLTGTKNTTGATITAGTYFYLNGQYCLAMQNIGNNADFTENTNYKVTTAGKWVNVKSACTWNGAAYLSDYTAYDDGNNYWVFMIIHAASPYLTSFEKIVTFPKGLKTRVCKDVFADNGSGIPILTSAGRVLGESDYIKAYAPTGDYYIVSITVPHQ